MSRHRVKNVGYDDDDYEDDDGYDSPDPEEQAFLQQCTAAVVEQLRAGQPSVTASKEEIQDALWHYYNDVEKSVNYLRGTLRDTQAILVLGWLQPRKKHLSHWAPANSSPGKKEKEIKKQQAATSQKPKAHGKSSILPLSLPRCVMAWLGACKYFCPLSGVHHVFV